MENCYFLNQRNYSISGALKGVRCNNQATVEEAKNGRIYHFCGVYSYTADRFVGAGESGHEHLGHAGPGRKCDAPACKLTPGSLCLRVSTQLYPYKG